MIDITIVGLGLIGGSIALDLNSQMGVDVYGFDLSPQHATTALKRNLIKGIRSFEEYCAQSDIIILSMPVDQIEHILPKILDNILNKTTVIDVGSTKESICLSIQGHKNRDRYVAAHPLAGTEFSGPSAAISDLFRKKKNIICEKEKSAKDALQTALHLFESLGMSTYFLKPSEHDRHLAYVSHLSHISSFTLSLTVLDIEKDENQIFNLASTGFESTVRLAKSSPTTWAPIFKKNKGHLAKALESYISRLESFKKAIESEDYSESINMMKEANRIKHILTK